MKYRHFVEDRSSGILKGKIRRNIFKIIIFLSVFYLSIYIVLCEYYRSHIPSRLDTAFWPVSFDQKRMRLSSCGAIVFKIKSNTLNEIRSEGIKFFQKTQYRNWRKTPMPPDYFSNGWIFGCESSLNTVLKVAITKSAQTGGSFYSQPSESGWLLILPELKIVMYIYGP